jgi:hypothetical protein
MHILHTLVEVRSGNIKTVTVDDMISPDGGYTQAYADMSGKDYAEYRAVEMLSIDDSDVWECISSVYVEASTYLPKEQESSDTNESNFELEVLSIVSGNPRATKDNLRCTKAEAFNTYLSSIAKPTTIAATLSVESLHCLLPRSISKVNIHLTETHREKYTAVVVLLRGDRSWWCDDSKGVVNNYVLNNWTEYPSEYGYVPIDKLGVSVTPRHIDLELSNILCGTGMDTPHDDGRVLVSMNTPSLGGGSSEYFTCVKTYNTKADARADIKSTNSVNTHSITVKYSGRQRRYMALVKDAWVVLTVP